MRQAVGGEMARPCTTLAILLAFPAIGSILGEGGAKRHINGVLSAVV
jgi:hypothetical protein